MTVFLAMILDAIIGEPRWLWSKVPHPAVLMGRLIGWLDERINQGSARKAKGVIAVVGLVVAMVCLGYAVSYVFGFVGEVILGAILLAQKSLVEHVRAVADAMRISLGDGRRAVAQIVGRDTAQMSPSDVSRSAIESAAENLSDGVSAPVFWFLLCGLPGLLAYKIVNTADSMIGYKTDRHIDFGWATARLDDSMNWVPARITALIIWGFSASTSWSTIIREAKLHRSPNAGWPEAAMAYRLGIALSGPRKYDGVLTADPFVNPTGREGLTPDDIDASTGILWQTWGVLLIGSGILGCLLL